MLSLYDHFLAGFRASKLIFLVACVLILNACGGGAGSVGIPTGKAFFSSAPTSLNMAATTTVSYTLGGGTAPYQASSSNTNVLKVEVKGSSFSLQSMVAGTAQITLSDAAGAQLTLSVTVDPGSTPVNLFVTAPPNLSLAVGKTNAFVIGGGKPSYLATSSNTAVAVVGMNGNSFFISGLAAGSAQIAIFDSQGDSTSVNVSVGTGGSNLDLYIAAAASITSAVGEVNNFAVGGGTAPYIVSSSNLGVATASILSNTLKVTSLAKGSALVSLFDANGKSVSLTVDVSNGGVATALFVAAPSAVSLGVGVKNSFAVGGGVAPYSVTSSNIAVASGTLLNGVLTITGLSSGSAQILVFDALGSSVPITLTVGIGSTSIPFYTTAGSTVSMPVAGSGSYKVGGGTPPYAATSSNSAIAQLSLSDTNLTVTGLVAGSAQISVFDATGTSLSFNVTVNGSGSTLSLYTTAGSSLTLPLSTTQTYLVGGGTAPYVVTSNHVGVVTATLTGTSLSLSSVGAGNAQVSIFDATGASIGFSVTVNAATGTPPLYTSAGTAVTPPLASIQSYLVGGGVAPYVASSSNTGVVTVGLVGSFISINAVGAGSALVSIFDATGTSVSFTVTIASSGSVTPFYTSASSSLNLLTGSTSTYTLGGGTPPYITSSSSPSTVTASISGSVLSITGVSAGTAQVTVLDASGSAITLSVSASQSGTSPLSIQPDGATGNVGDGLRFLVSAGTPPYAVTAANTNITTVSPASVATNGGNFIATLINAGTTTVTIVDALGQSKSLNITASLLSTSLRLSPSALLVGEDSTTSIALNIYGGTAPYRAFTSDQTLSSVSTAGAVLTIAVGSTTNRCINPIDSSGVRVPFGTFDVTITVLDSLGASATTVMTIKDNGLGTGVVVTQPSPFAAPCG